MSFLRLPHPHVIAHSRGASPLAVCTFVSEREIAEVMARVSDPFGIDDRCLLGPNGEHVGIGSCGDVACRYCGKIFSR